MAKPKLLAEWFWIDRWEGSSAVALPMEQQGLYRAMLTRAWRLGGSLPADPAQIQREVRCTPQEWKRAWPAVSPYWRPDPADPSRIINDTQREIMAEARRRSDDASAHARRAARARHERSPGNARAEPGEMPPSPSPDEDSETRTRVVVVSEASTADDDDGRKAPRMCPACRRPTLYWGTNPPQWFCGDRRGGCGKVKLTDEQLAAGWGAPALSPL